MSSTETQWILKSGKKYNLVKTMYSEYNKNYKFYELRNKKTGMPLGNKLYTNQREALKLFR